MSNLVLYHFEGCPFSERVRSFLKENNIAIPTKDIHRDSKARDELIKIGGKSQVPCLVIDGKALYESSDIINWLRKNSKRHDG